LGIPPAQYEALAGGNDMGAVLRARVERLACGFSLDDNYFAWQAFGRCYSGEEHGPLPPYLRRDQFEAVRARVDRVEVLNRSITEYLAGCPAASRDRYVLLDAQDWMTDAQLNALWAEITRTARSGARVIFRTAAAPSLLRGRLDPALLDRWRYEEAASLAFTARDRSAIYGGFHLYVLKA
jgi:S-adenosylmethionine-diacylglycerol 3-amino-3-carboxypropyl transferase